VRPGEFVGEALLFERLAKNHGDLTLLVDRQGFGEPLAVTIPADKIETVK
jgi:hypothetical protein